MTTSTVVFDKLGSWLSMVSEVSSRFTSIPMASRSASERDIASVESVDDFLTALNNSIAYQPSLRQLLRMICSYSTVTGSESMRKSRLCIAFVPMKSSLFISRHRYWNVTS